MNDNTSNFERKLSNMSKPDLPNLAHEGNQEKAVMSAKEKQVLSFWWLCIPVYIIAAMLMKTLYNPQASFHSGIHTANPNYTGILLFVVLPVLVIVINLVSIKQLLFLSLKKQVWVNIGLVLVSILVLFIYLL